MDQRYKNGNVMRVYGDDCEFLPDEESYYGDFLLSLCDAIDMQQLTDPTIANYIDFDDELENGISATMMITTSHIGIHSWLNLGGIMLVVASCKDFDPNIVIEMVRNWFKPKYIDPEII